MALLELGGKRFTIPVGEVTLGSDASCAISLSGAAVLPRHALLQGQADGQVIIRKVSPAADVLSASASAPSRHPSCTATRSRSAVTSSPSWMSGGQGAPSS